MSDSPEADAAGNVSVVIPAKWVRRARSPWVWVIASLTGVSVTFAPMALYFMGRAKAGVLNPFLWICVATVYLVPFFYMGLASVVLGQLWREPGGKPGSAMPKMRLRFGLRTLLILITLAAAAAGSAAYWSRIDGWRGNAGRIEDFG